MFVSTWSVLVKVTPLTIITSEAFGKFMFSIFASLSFQGFEVLFSVIGVILLPEHLIRFLLSLNLWLIPGQLELLMMVD